MRSWKTAVSRRICAMFGNRCYFLLHHHRLFPMELISTIPAIMIILITVIIGTRVEAIRFADPFPSSFSTVISSGHSGPEAILARIRLRRNASSYLVKRLRDLAVNSRKDMKSNNLQINDIRNENEINRQRFITSDSSMDQNIPISENQRFTKLSFSNHANIPDNNQHQKMLRKKSNLSQQSQNIALTNSLPIQTSPKLIPSKFSRFTNRQDCNGSDCLKNNHAISLYIPENNTNNGQLPPLLLISNKPSNSNNRENYNLQQGTTLKLPKLHTGIKILESNIQQSQKPIPLPPSDVSYHTSQINSQNYDEYGGVKLRGPIPPPIPPFAGGAQLTDFIQPIDTAVQTQQIYENIIPNHISSAAYYSKNKPNLLASENRGIYDNFQSEPLIPFDSKLGIHEPATSLSPLSVYSSYSDQNTDYFTTPPPYESQYDSYSTAKIDDKINEGMIRSGIREKVINFENINVETYPSIQFASTDHYPQLSAKEISPGPPAAMPVMDYSDEQKQIPDITDQSHGTSFDYTNFATTETIGNDEINYGAQVEYTYGTESKTTTTGTTVTATTSVVLPYTVQVVDENKQTFPESIAKTTTTTTTTITPPSPPTTTRTTTPTTKRTTKTTRITTTTTKTTSSSENARMNETSPEQSRSTTFEIVPERYETIATAYPGTTDGQISSTKQTIKPALPDINYPIPFTQTIAPNIRVEIEKEGKLELPEVISQPTTYTYPSFNATRITSPKPVGIVPNRLRGKAHLICKEDGLQFGINTLFPFTGQIFARDRKPAAQCYFTFHEATSVRVMMPYSTCGIRNIEQQSPETQYHMQIIVIFQQKDNTSTMQSFLTQCIHQKVQYRKQVIPKRIEEALEELRLVPMKLEHKAQIPECMMRIVTEEEHGHGDDGTEIEIVNLGQPMRIEWSLVPESDAYGFHVRNCTVRDTVSNTEYVVIDEQGCSTDINIFSHPHYDTYHDIARVHWHAFKVPDINQLSIKCSIEICTDIPDTTSGLTNCDNIPSPPFCPDLITSATNALLSDYEKKVIRKRREHKSFQQHVHADICFGDKKDEYCSSENYQTDRERHINMFKDNSRKQYCFPRLWLTIWTGLSVLTALLAITVYGYCHCSRRRRYASIKLTANSKITTTKQQQ